MENRKRTRHHIPKRCEQISPIFFFLFSISFLALGCGAPGDPTPPVPVVPAAVSDLTVRQAGDGAQLAFTLPAVSVFGDKLSAPPALEILRGSLNSGGSPEAKSFRVVYTIPGALVDNYRSRGQIVFSDPIAPAETKTHPGAAIAYTVRTRASEKRASANSNVVVVRVFPVPEPVSSLEARVTETAIELSWSIPTRTSAGDPLPSLEGYHIYRTETDSVAASPSPSLRSAGKADFNLVMLASSQANSYRDPSFTFDRTYLYIVRSVIQVDGNSLESSDSQLFTVTPRDIFPPAPPQNLVGVLPRCAASAGLYVDLSWAINLETDLAGYRVYRSDEEATRGQALESLWLVPSYRDTSVQSGHSYWYSVTALDRAGNESPPSAPIVVVVEAEPCKP